MLVLKDSTNNLCRTRSLDEAPKAYQKGHRLRRGFSPFEDKPHSKTSLGVKMKQKPITRDLFS